MNPMSFTADIHRIIQNQLTVRYELIFSWLRYIRFVAANANASITNNFGGIFKQSK